MSTTEANAFLIALSKVPGVGPATLQKMLAVFGSPQKAWEARLSDLAQTGFPAEVQDKWIDSHASISPDAEWEKVNKAGVQVIACGERSYPDLLSQLAVPPPLLYVTGNAELLSSHALAIVGTRKPTSYGVQATEHFTAALVNENLTIVSGLALGVDSIAHRIAVSQKGKTVAVLGSGVDQIFPRTNLKLAEDILAAGGTILSEFPLGTEPAPYQFPQRNRVVSGLSLGTLVVEAGIKSGALITANYALEQNREVFAVPGPIFSSKSGGTNSLIQRGAKLAATVEDVLAELNLPERETQRVAKSILPISAQERAIYDFLRDEPQHLDAIARALDQPVQTISTSLVMMEMKGIVTHLGSGRYGIKY